MTEQDRDRLANAIELALENGATESEVMAEAAYVIENSEGSK